MQTDSKNKTSFFDDDDPSALFIFKKMDKNSKDLESPQIVRETLIRQVAGSNTSPQQGSYALHNRTLVYYKNMTSKLPEMYLELAHCKLKELTPTEENTNYGFSLSKNGVMYEFYSTEKEIIDDWVVVLKSVCVLSTFHEEYKALKMIGRGSFAKVYLVESKKNGKMYAVKAFTKESVIISNKANAKPSMINEIDLMRVLDHENIIKLYEVYETEKSIYLVIELIQGKSLQDILKKPTFHEEFSDVRIMRMMYSLLDALAYLASKGIMHRDLKPDNILVSNKTDKLKIADFGLATYIDLAEYLFKKCGTPGYIAPEVFKYDQKVQSTFYDHHCDVFSAGCIFFYMLFGKPFFNGSNSSEILKLNRKFTSEFETANMIQREFDDPDSKIPREGINLLLQLLEFDPSKRISASQALSHPYFAPLFTNSLFSMDLSYSSPSKVRSFSIDYQMHSRPDSIASPDGFKDRFVEKDSLYLDMGKAELNGKVYTLLNGSHNDSLLLQKGDSRENLGSRKNSMSSFSKNEHSPEQKNRKSFRGGNHILKAAIFRNMQKNSDFPSEEMKDDMMDIKKRRRESERSSNQDARSPISNNNRKSPNSVSEVDSLNDVGGEKSQVQYKMNKIKAETPEMKPSKQAHSYLSRPKKVSLLETLNTRK